MSENGWLTSREIAAAAKVPRTKFPGYAECKNCGEVWYAHLGELCPVVPLRIPWEPNGRTTFDPVDRRTSLDQTGGESLLS
jgi:hypothetical protein